MPYNLPREYSQLDRAEHDVEQQSAALKKPLALRDLVLTQILFVVGSSWVGAAAKLGQAHLFFWLLAILLFYIPQAAVVIYLSNRMPLEGGIYQWAKLGFNEFAGFIVAWNLWLLSITVIALGGMFTTTNISYAIGPGAAWLPNSKWCVSLISAALVGGLGWTCVRGLSLGKWVHNIGAFAMLIVYSALMLLPLLGLARGELKSYHPLQLALPTMSIFYCFNIFTKLAVGALSGFEYVAILAGETRSPARDIGRSVLIASPVIALMFILGTSSVLAFIGDNSDRSHRSRATNTAARAAFVSDRRNNRVDWDFVNDRAYDFFDQRSRHRQLAIANGRRLGPFATDLVLAFASALQNANQLDHLRRAVTLVIGIASQLGAGIQEAFQLVDNAANVFYGIVYFTMFAIPIFGAAAIRSRRSNLVAYRGDLWRCRLAVCDFFHRLPDYRRAKPAEFRRENYRSDRNRERRWGCNLRRWQETPTNLAAACGYPRR